MTGNNNTTDKLKAMADEEWIDIPTSIGSKEAKLCGELDDGSPLYVIWHSISDTYTHFTESAIIEVLEGRRDPWVGDLPKEDEEHERGD